MDSLLGIDYARDVVCVGFIANETLSIVENAGLMGIPLPEGIKRAVDVRDNPGVRRISSGWKPGYLE